MKIRGTWSFAVAGIVMLLGVLASACGGGDCPECNCPVCPAATPVEPDSQTAR